MLNECWDKLSASGMFVTETMPNEHTILLGEGSLFDPPRFIAFMSILEEKLIREFSNPEFVLVIRDIHDFNNGNPVLTLATTAAFLVALADSQSSVRSINN